MEEYNFIGARLMPVLPIRGISVFPGTMLTFDVERPASKAALDAALAGDQIIFLTAQKDPMVAQPSDADVYHMGTICRIKQVLKNPNGKTVRVLVDGLVRGEMDAMYMKGDCAYAYVSSVTEELNRDGISVTRISSKGAYLKAGNVTLIIGVDKMRVDHALEVIRKNTKKRNITFHDMYGNVRGMPLEITIGGATVFVLDVEQFIKM